MVLGVVKMGIYKDIVEAIYIINKMFIKA